MEARKWRSMGGWFHLSTSARNNYPGCGVKQLVLSASENYLEILQRTIAVYLIVTKVVLFSIGRK